MRAKLLIGLAVVAALSAGCGATMSTDDVASAALGTDSAKVGVGCEASPKRITLQQGLAQRESGVVYGGAVDATLVKALRGASPGLDSCRAKGGRNHSTCVMRWDVSGIKPGTTVQQACLALSVTDPSVRTFSAFPLLRGWEKADVSWTAASRLSPWKRGGAWSSLDRGSEAVGNLTARTPGRYQVVLPTALVQGWVDDPASNHGVIFGNLEAWDGITFVGSDAADTSQRPSLVIVPE